jgi:hypothetical protein
VHVAKTQKNKKRGKRGERGREPKEKGGVSCGREKFPVSLPSAIEIATCKPLCLNVGRENIRQALRLEVEEMEKEGEEKRFHLSPFFAILLLFCAQ